MHFYIFFSFNLENFCENLHRPITFSKLFLNENSKHLFFKILIDSTYLQTGHVQRFNKIAVKYVREKVEIIAFNLL